MTLEEKRKLLEALTRIKTLCLEMAICTDCPLAYRKTSKCWVKEVKPAYWEVKTAVDETWRAFYE